MKEMPYIPLNVSDLLGDDIVALMSTLEVGAYILLLCRAWQQDPAGSIPDNDEYLATWVRMDLDEWLKIKEKVLMPFVYNPSCVGGRWEQRRMMEDHEGIRETLRVRSERGKKGAEARWGAKAMPKQDVSNGKKEKEKEKEKITWSEEEGWKGINDEWITHWRKTYPLVDVARELEMMNDWLISNPTRRKSNYPRFIGNWLKSNMERTSNGNQPRATEHHESGLGRKIDLYG